jgi:hypothetical protein
MKKKRKKVSAFQRVTICIPANLWNWILKESRKGEYAGNKSSFFRNAVLAYKNQQ